MKEKNFFVDARLTRTLGISLSLELLSLYGLYLTRTAMPNLLGDILIVIACSALAELGALIVAFTLWDVQYNIGPDTHRGGILGVFNVATSLGLAASPALASGLLLRGWQVSLLLSVAVIAATIAGAIGSQRTRTGITLTAS